MNWWLEKFQLNAINNESVRRVFDDTLHSTLLFTDILYFWVMKQAEIWDYLRVFTCWDGPDLHHSLQVHQTSPFQIKIFLPPNIRRTDVDQVAREVGRCFIEWLIIYIYWVARENFHPLKGKGFIMRWNYHNQSNLIFHISSYFEI